VRRRRWIKRSLLAIAVVLTGAAALSYWAFKGTPDYYHRPQLSAQERADAANRATQKVLGTSTWANDLQASEHRAILNSAGTTTAPATSRRQSHTVSFSERELNALFEQWSSRVEQTYSKHIRDPAIALRADRIILVGTVAEMGTVASAHFQPLIDDQGRLLLTLESVRAGRLPMPEMVWAAQRDRAVAALRARLPKWQAGATVAPNGVANADAVAAHLSKLLFDVLARRPREPVLFLPFDTQRPSSAVPVRLTSVRVTDGELTLTVESMTPADRAALLDRIREPVPGATALAQ
jgi:hypothetical protein